MNSELIRCVRIASGGRCEYCRLPDALDPLPFQIDHVIAQQHGGPSRYENLAWCCLHCNKHKGPNIAGIDPDDDRAALFFHPRKQSWQRHFAYDGPVLIGRTRSGRATIQVLAINAAEFVEFRSELIDEGFFEW